MLNLSREYLAKKKVTNKSNLLLILFKLLLYCFNAATASL
jgi:hypothetical protein